MNQIWKFFPGKNKEKIISTATLSLCTCNKITGPVSCSITADDIYGTNEIIVSGFSGSNISGATTIQIGDITGSPTLED